MSKKKLERIAEIKTFPNVSELQPEETKVWKKNFFRNNNPLVLELGCGRGEYTVALAAANPDTNFIGVDIKGARIWRGAKTAIDDKIPNAAFIRMEIEHICQFFDKNEVSGIWITFPDPQPKKPTATKRLTHPEFINKYREVLKKDALIHLKTDNDMLYHFTLDTIEEMGLKLHYNSDNIYALPLLIPELEIKTTYEMKFLEKEIPIKYIRFSI
jgi:tRNA (guanine-N7-)-methyltransferase